MAVKDFDVSKILEFVKGSEFEAKAAKEARIWASDLLAVAEAPKVNREWKTTWEYYSDHVYPVFDEPFWKPDAEEAQRLYDDGVRKLKLAADGSPNVLSDYIAAVTDFRKAAPGCRSARQMLDIVYEKVRADFSGIMKKLKDETEENWNGLTHMKARERNAEEFLSAYRKDKDFSYFYEGVSEAEKDAKETSELIPKLERDRRRLIIYNELLALMGHTYAASILSDYILPDNHGAYAEPGELAAAIKIQAESGDTDAALKMAKMDVENSIRWYQFVMNLDARKALECTYQIVSIRTVGGGRESERAARFRNAPESIMSGDYLTMLKRAVEENLPQAIIDLMSFSYGHEKWARDHKKQLIPVFRRYPEIRGAKDAADFLKSVPAAEKKRQDAFQRAEYSFVNLCGIGHEDPCLKDYVDGYKKAYDQILYKDEFNNEVRWFRQWTRLFLICALLPALLNLPAAFGLPLGSQLQVAASFLLFVGSIIMGISWGKHEQDAKRGIAAFLIFGLIGVHGSSVAYIIFLLYVPYYMFLRRPLKKAEEPLLSREERLSLYQEVKDAWKDSEEKIYQAACDSARKAALQKDPDYPVEELQNHFQEWAYSAEYRKTIADIQERYDLSYIRLCEKEDKEEQMSGKSSDPSENDKILSRIAGICVLIIAVAGIWLLVRDHIPKTEHVESPSETVAEQTEAAPPAEEQVEDADTEQLPETAVQPLDEKIPSLYADLLSESDALVLEKFADKPVMLQIHGLEEFMQGREIVVEDFYGTEDEDGGMRFTYKIKDQGIPYMMAIGSSGSSSLDYYCLSIDTLNLSTFWDDLCSELFHLEAFALPEDLLGTLDSSGYRDSWESSGSSWSARLYDAGNRTNMVVHLTK